MNLTEDAIWESISRSYSRSSGGGSLFSSSGLVAFGIRHAPPSVRYQNALAMTEHMAQLIGASYDPGTGLARPAPWFTGLPAPPTSIGLNNFIAAIAVPALSNLWETSLKTQTRYNHDRVLIALRRYFLAHGNYPAQMSQIADDLPKDRVTGEPIHYHLAADHSKITLWSANHSGKPGDDTKPPKDPAAEGWIGLELPLGKPLGATR